MTDYYDGPQHKCGTTLRYKSTGKCVACTRSAVRGIEPSEVMLPTCSAPQPEPPDLESRYLLALLRRDAVIWKKHYRKNVERGEGSDDDQLTATGADKTYTRAKPAPAPAPAPLLPRDQKLEARRLRRIKHKRNARAGMTQADRDKENAKRRARKARETPEQRERRLAVRRAWKAAREGASASLGPRPGSTRPTIRLTPFQFTPTPHSRTPTRVSRRAVR